MLKRLLVSKPAVAIGSALAAAYVRLVYATSTIKREPADTDAKLFDQHPQILAMWHGQFVLLPKLKPKRPADVRAMVSRHGDAEIIGAVLQKFGMDLIRGAGAGKEAQPWWRNRLARVFTRVGKRRDCRHDRRRAARSGAPSR